MRRELALSPEQRERVKNVLWRSSGLCLAKALNTVLDNSIELAASEMKVSAGTLLSRLSAGDPQAIQTLLEHTLVHESYFFRQPRHFEALRQRVLERRGAGETAVIWSAGCATGEEAYSLAMTVADCKGAAARIIASDLSAAALRRAREGGFHGWSLRALDPSWRERFFVTEAASARVRHELLPPIEWVRHNLLDAEPPVRGCDAIFCRNVLIYFDQDTALGVLERLIGALAPGGHLMLGTAEAPLAMHFDLEWCEADQLFVRSTRRKASKAQRAERPRPPSPSPVAHLPEPLGALPSRFDQAREAARRGLSLEAERLARAAAEEGCPESYLLLAMMAEERGDLYGALEAARAAVRLDPSLAMGHATLAMLLRRAGEAQEAERARLSALESIALLEESTPLRSVEPITAGALRRALEPVGERA